MSQTHSKTENNPDGKRVKEKQCTTYDQLIINSMIQNIRDGKIATSMLWNKHKVKPIG